MTEIQQMLYEKRDVDYAAFQRKLTPVLAKEVFIGVRMPEMRSLARKLAIEPAAEEFLKVLPHEYYEENILHGLLLSSIKDYARCIAETERFLPYIDNWAVCDCFSPVVFKNHKEELIEKIRKWSESKHIYTCRFGIGMLMKHFLDRDFKAGYLAIPASVKSEEYYVNMMLAWFFATALAKQWENTIPLLENCSLGKWIHNKTIQKACESYRVTDEHKQYLRLLKRK